VEDQQLRPAIPGIGLIAVKSNSQMEEDSQRRTAAAQPPPLYVSELASHIDRCWTKAKEAKQPVERQMLKNLRQRNGQYEASKLAAIQQMGGSQVYMLLTATKCRAAEAWINDVMRPAGDRPWTVDPTPIPELPPDIEAEIIDEVRQVTMEVMEQAQAAGEQWGDAELINEIRQFAKTRKDETFQKVRDKAKTRAKRMGDLIADQLAQGGWHDAFSAVISDFVTHKAAILKGPVIRNRKVSKWVNEGGKWVVRTESALVPEFDRVSPFDLYPAPDSRNPDDGYLIERHRVSRSELQALIGVPGYKEDKLREVLKDYASGLHINETIDTERDQLEFSGETDVHRKGEKIEALEFWGSVQGKMLLDWGIEDVDIDSDIDYEVNAWKVGQHVIRAILNPDTLGRKPYNVDSYERIAGSFWGKGVPELMSDIQDVCNAVARAIVNNAGLASGPQVEVNIERCDKSEGIYPWKIWPSTNQQMSESPAIRFNQPQIITDQLLRVFEFFASLSEDSTGIPRWAFGNTNIGGAGATSSGLSMLMTHASRGIKESIAHLDTMISGCITRMYDYNMAYDEDESRKGDCRVVARGSSSLVAKEQQIVRMRETLAATNNPTDIEILGVEGRAKMLKAALEGLDLGVDDVIPDEYKLKQLVEKIEQRNQMMMQMAQQAGPKGAPPPANSESLDAAGNRAGGVDANLFQNQPGQATGMRVAG